MDLTNEHGERFTTEAPKWLRDGDVVKVRLEFVGPVRDAPVNLYWPGN